jgi:hypothetical protein
MERGRDVEEEEAEELMVVLRDEARMRSRDLFPASVSEDDEAAACSDGCGWRPCGRRDEVLGRFGVVVRSITILSTTKVSTQKEDADVM